MPLDILYANPGLPVTYSLDSDPTLFSWGGTNAEIGSILYRTDNSTIYRKTSGVSTGWTLTAISSAGVGGVSVLDEGVAIPNNPHTSINLVGAGVTAADAGAGVATITIPGGMSVQDEGIAIPNNPHTTFNLVGAGVTATDAGAGVATITIPGGAAIQSGGVAIPNNPHGTINVTSGILAVDSGGGVATFSIDLSTIIALLNISGAGDFGPATDGTVTFDGVAAVAGYTGPVGNVYTAVRDVYFQNATINNGIRLDNHTYTVNVKGTLTFVGSGRISYDGQSATGIAGAPISAAVGLLPTGAVGGNGGAAGFGAGVSGGSCGQGPLGISTTAVPGGVGGAPPTDGGNGGITRGGGGGASLANGGGGGGATITGSANGLNGHWLAKEQAIIARTTTGQIMQIGTGGGGGAGSGAVGVGGGGGSSGAWGVIKAANIVGFTTSSITARGGNGANATAAVGANIAGAGGGGGGGGGMIIILTAMVTPPVTSDFTGAGVAAVMCTGGTRGLGGAGTGTGSAGSNGGSGGNGIVVVFN